MLCPQCAQQYSEHDRVCPACNTPLQPLNAAAAPEPGPVFVRPAGIDQTFASIRQDISAIDRRSPRPAGFFIRLTAYMIDNFLLTLITTVPTAAAVVLLRRSGVSISGDIQELMRWAWLLFVLPNTVLTFMYFGYFHAVTGQTVGKLLCGVRVVTIDGHPIGWVRSLVRCAGYFLSSFFLYLGFFWAVLNRRKRAWHDYLADTVVVYDSGKMS